MPSRMSFPRSSLMQLSPPTASAGAWRLGFCDSPLKGGVIPSIHADLRFPLGNPNGQKIELWRPAGTTMDQNMLQPMFVVTIETIRSKMSAATFRSRQGAQCDGFGTVPA